MLATRVMAKHSLSDKTDDQLMTSWRRNNAAAFDEIYERYRTPLWRYLFNNCRDETMAGEMFQDVWLRVISASTSYEHKGKFRAWLFTLAHHRLVDHFRRPEPTRESEDAEQMPVDGQLDKQVDETRQYSRLTEIVGALPFDQRQAFYLREECGFTVREIAEIQGVGLEAAKSRLRYAYARMRQALGNVT